MLYIIVALLSYYYPFLILIYFKTKLYKLLNTILHSRYRTRPNGIPVMKIREIPYEGLKETRPNSSILCVI